MLSFPNSSFFILNISTHINMTESSTLVNTPGKNTISINTLNNKSSTITHWNKLTLTYKVWTATNFNAITLDQFSPINILNHFGILCFFALRLETKNMIAFRTTVCSRTSFVRTIRTSFLTFRHCVSPVKYALSIHQLSALSSGLL